MSRLDDFLGNGQANGKHNGEAKKAKQARTVRQLDPFVPFPIHELPEPICSFTDHASRAIGCDPAFIALPALSAAAGLIGNSRSIHLKDGWDEPPILWCVMIADSGTLKTPAIKAAIGPLYRMQGQLVRAFKDDEEDRRRERLRQRERRRGRPSDGCYLDDDDEERICERFLCNDVTVERLAMLLEENPRGLFVARDELSAWLASFSQYKGKAAISDLPKWLEMSQAGSILVDRKGGDKRSLFIRRATVSLYGAIQPGVYVRAMTAEFRECGLVARLLPAMPPDIERQWTECKVDPLIADAYANCMRTLRSLPCDDEDGLPAPLRVHMKPESKQLYIDFYNDWNKQRAWLDGDLKSAYSKLEAYAARLALVHHVVSRCGQGTDIQAIEPVSMRAGIAMARWFGAETRRVYATLTESDGEKQLRKLYEFIRRRGGKMTPRDLSRSNASSYPHSEVAELALDELVSMSLADWCESETGPQGGRTSRFVQLRNLISDAPTTRQNRQNLGASRAVGADAPNDSICTPKNGCQDGSFVGFVGLSEDLKNKSENGHLEGGDGRAGGASPPGIPPSPPSREPGDEG